MSRASCILIGCYRGDGGGSGNGRCGHRTHSPVKKKVSRIKKQKQKRLTKGLRHVVLSLICCLGCYGACHGCNHFGGGWMRRDGGMGLW